MKEKAKEMIFLNVQSCTLNDKGEWEVKALVQEKARNSEDEDWEEASLESFATDKDFNTAYGKAIDALMQDLIAIIGDDEDRSLLEAFHEDKEELEELKGKEM